MFNLFKRKNNRPKVQPLPEIFDIDEKPLTEGDIVEALRYDLGKCRIVLEDRKYFYESLENGKKVIWLKMIDAVTERQKVKKVS